MKARVIGMLDDGSLPDGRAREALAEADLVIGGARLLERAREQIRPEAERRDLTGRLARLPEWIREALDAGRRVAVLASGDPLCHGVGGFLCKRLGIERLEILPHLSAVQLACARLGVPWADARIVSVHGPDAGEWNEASRGRDHGLYPLFRACMDAERIVAFTSPENDPARLARMLLHEGWGEAFRLHVAENLAHENERLLRDRTPAEIAAMRFDGLTMLVLERAQPGPAAPRFGLPDDAFAQRKPEKGLITKREARAVSLALMGLRRDAIVWDIGAGSGSVGLEAAMLCPDGWVYAIEKNEADCVIARENAARLGVRHYTLLHGRAPDELDRWPDPDAVFIGGSGGELPALIRLALARLRPGGRLVVNLVTLENLAAATAALEEADAAWTATQLQAARSRPILGMHRLAAQNPVWILAAEKPEAEKPASPLEAQP